LTEKENAIVQIQPPSKPLARIQAVVFCFVLFFSKRREGSSNVWALFSMQYSAEFIYFSGALSGPPIWMQMPVI